jgi:hypothetical protein
MKPFVLKFSGLITGLALLFSASNLFGQTNHPAKKILVGFDIAGQSNLDVVAGVNGDKVPCPPEYTNVISNTNLFSPDEYKLLREIPLIYGKVATTNSAPLGSVLIDLKTEQVTNKYYGISIDWVARFQFTNSDSWDEVRPGGDLRIHKVRNKDGDGYDIGYDIYNNGESVGPRYGGRPGGADFWFYQVKHGVYDGLHVIIHHGDHCGEWMRYSNGMAVDKWLCWWSDGNNLFRWIKFKEPYDFEKHRW